MEMSRPPSYDTDPHYNPILSRKELSKQIYTIITRSKKYNCKVKMQKLIDEVVSHIFLESKSRQPVCVKKLFEI